VEAIIFVTSFVTTSPRTVYFCPLRTSGNRRNHFYLAVERESVGCRFESYRAHQRLRIFPRGFSIIPTGFFHSGHSV
jgi:hypothetical protein